MGELKVIKRKAVPKTKDLTEAAATEMSVTWLKEPRNMTIFSFTESGHLKSLPSNFAAILRNDPYLRGKLSYNLLSGRVMIENVFWDGLRHPFRDTDLSALRCFISSVYEIDAAEKLTAAILKVAYENAFNPVLDVLDSLPPWDGVPRLGKLFPRYLGAQESELTEDITRLLIRAAIMRARHPGIKFDTAVVFVDRQQGTGKSTLVRFLALEDEFFLEDLKSFAPQDKPTEKLIGKWYCEVGEMGAVKSTKSIEYVRSFLSCQVDNYRTPYSRNAEDWPRRCVFVGTSNSLEALPDDKAGNRRFIPLVCDGTRAERHPLADEAETRGFVRQCYAEVLATMDDNDFLILPHKWDDVIREMQARGTPDDPRVGMIQGFLDDLRTDIVCSRMILDGVFPDEHSEKGKDKLCREISAIMNHKISGWVPYGGAAGTSKSGTYTFQKYGKQRSWQRIPETTETEFVSIPVSEQQELFPEQVKSPEE